MWTHNCTHCRGGDGATVCVVVSFALPEKERCKFAWIEKEKKKNNSIFGKIFFTIFSCLFLKKKFPFFFFPRSLMMMLMVNDDDDDDDDVSDGSETQPAASRSFLSPLYQSAALFEGCHSPPSPPAPPLGTTDVLTPPFTRG